MRRRTIALFLLLAALAGAAVSRAYLYAAGRAATENVITYGRLKMRLNETEPGADGTEAPVEADAVLRLTGTSEQTVRRKITVTNICKEEMYLRARLSVSAISDDGKIFALLPAEASWSVNSVDGPDGGWRPSAEDDGWYYYTRPLGYDNTTSSLLADDRLVFHTGEIAKTYPQQELTLSVEVQAVQTKNNGADVWSAQGWPEEASKP